MKQHLSFPYRNFTTQNLVACFFLIHTIYLSSFTLIQLPLLHLPLTEVCLTKVVIDISLENISKSLISNLPCSSFDNSTQARIIEEESTSVEKIIQVDLSVRNPLGHFLNKWFMRENPAHCRFRHQSSDGTECIRKQSEEASGSKALGSSPPWLGLQFWLPGSFI